MKINGVDVINNGYFAYDGCHKIYVLETDDDMENSIKTGYNVYPIKDIKNCYNNSCDLRFISNWSLDKTYVGQFEKYVKFEFDYNC